VLGMASTALSVWPPTLPVARWFNGGAALALDGMAALAGVAAQAPWPDLTGERISGTAGATGALLLVACFLAQAEARSVARLLGVPAGLLLAWFAWA
ncbi:MAG: hypothetical protein ACKO3A_01785, partial [Opitutia bacterium]